MPIWNFSGSGGFFRFAVLHPVGRFFAGRSTAGQFLAGMILRRFFRFVSVSGFFGFGSPEARAIFGGMLRIFDPLPGFAKSIEVDDLCQITLADQCPSRNCHPGD